MIAKNLISSLLVVGVLAASVTTEASARDRHGNGAAIAAGILGAVVVGSIIANSNPTYAAPPRYVESQRDTYVYTETESPVYAQSAEPVYYAPQVRYYRPAPVVYAAPEVYVDEEYGGRYEHRWHHRRDHGHHYVSREYRY